MFCMRSRVWRKGGADALWSFECSGSNLSCFEDGSEKKKEIKRRGDRKMWLGEKKD